jgi:alpha-beta hydrolase superfamily lysophospholipase
MLFDIETSHASPSGATLKLYVTHAKAPPRGVIQINHGLAERAARYSRFAEAMSARGFYVYAHDHRGHGATTATDAPPRQFGDPDGAAKVIADVEAVHDLIAKEHPGLPVIVFGHSMGGFIALNFVFRYSARVHAAAIWNANFSAGLLGRVGQAILAYERFRLGSDMPSRMIPKLTFQAWAKQIPDRRTEFDWLSRDPAEVDKYVADPLCGWDASVSMWSDVFRFVFFGADDRNFASVRKDLPFSLVGGEKDPATDGGKAVHALAERMARMAFSRVTTRVYAETRHESLNELNRNIITEDFAAWADSVVAP